MNLMLLLIFASIGVGLFGQRWKQREMRIVVLIATALTVTYFVRPMYMT